MARGRNARVPGPQGPGGGPALPSTRRRRLPAQIASVAQDDDEDHQMGSDSEDIAETGEDDLESPQRDGFREETANSATIIPRTYNDMVEVMAGPEGEVFVVHAHNLCLTSQFFKNAVSELSTEGDNKRVWIPSVDPSIFQLYLDWAYTDEFLLEEADLPVVLGCNGNDHVASCQDRLRWEAARILLHVDCYVAAHFLQDDTFKIVIVDALREFTSMDHHLGYSSSVIKRTWSICERGCGIQRLIIDVLVWRSRSDDHKRITSRLPSEFVADLSERLLQMLGKPKAAFTPRVVDKCF